MFQSTAHPKAGRNLRTGSAAPETRGFNPRPTRRQAETRECPPRSLPRRFNPRPTRRQAETPRRQDLQRPPDVSIHGPPEGRPKRAGPSPVPSPRMAVSIHGPPEGRPKHRRTLRLRFRPGRFNPRPTRRQAETRTRPPAGCRWRCFNPRPTRRQAETTPRLPGYAVARVSIHGPPEGRPKPPCRSLRPPTPCFNPRPTRRQAETCGFLEPPS